MKNIKKSFKKRIKSILQKLIYKPLKKHKILKLIKNLRPKKTDIELIRLGGDNDGGYLIPDDLENLGTCFSPGIGNVTSFEHACANLGMKIFMADASVENPVLGDNRFKFINKFIGNPDKENFLSLENWIASSDIKIKEDLILQMDIEGHEYDVLNSTSVKTLKRFRIIVIEFHALHFLWNDQYYDQAVKAFSKLLKNHTCVHIHPNNCCGIQNIEGIDFPLVAEFTFLRKNRIKGLSKVKYLPHKLDQDNTANASINLPKIWY